MLRHLSNQVLTVSKGWSDSYGLFTRGESRAVFSYVSSELYHLLSEKSERYKALSFSEGHPDQVEYAAILASSKNKDLGRRFLDYLLTTEAQRTIATKNWMFPVTTDGTKALPKAFIDQMNRFKPLVVDRSLYTKAKRRHLIQSWSRILSQKGKAEQ